MRINKSFLVLPWVLISSSAYHNGEVAVRCKAAENCQYIVDTMNHNEAMFPHKDADKILHPKTWQQPFDYDGACHGSCEEDK